MKVFILCKSEDEDTEIVDVFSNEKSAEKRRQEVVDDYGSDPDDYTIDSWEVED